MIPNVTLKVLRSNRYSQQHKIWAWLSTSS